MKKYNVAVVGATGAVGEKMLDILNAMVFDTDKMGKHKHRYCTACSRIDTGSGWIEAGYQPQQIARCNIDKYGCDNRKKPAPLFAGNIYHEFFHP